MDFVLEVLVSILIVVGGFFALVGSIGLVKLPDLLTRLHGPTKATTLGVGGALDPATLLQPRDRVRHPARRPAGEGGQLSEATRVVEEPTGEQVGELTIAELRVERIAQAFGPVLDDDGYLLP